MVGRTATFRQHIMLTAPLMLSAALLAAAIVVRECNQPDATDVVREASVMSERGDPPPPGLLDRRLPEIRFDRVELKDALDFLQDVVQYPVDVDWPCLARAGVTPSTPITAR